ncbi:MAG: rhamnulokinase [Clostridia bacterium]|nr:rhamnulokinase [Clostridia bacterium]
MKVLAFDFGASSGRAIVYELKKGKLAGEEVHRFDNDPVTVGKSFYWDLLRLFHEIKAGIVNCKKAGHTISAIGIDTWGVDYGLLDENDDILSNPHHYRDARTQSVELTEAQRREIYAITGIQHAFINTLFQFMCEVKSPTFDKAKTALFMPDLFNFLLTGEKRTEYTIASTSQMLNARARKFDDTLLENYGIKNLFPDIIEPGTIVGYLSDALCEELGVDKVPVIAVASHDTASAVVATPMENPDESIFISCGTWLLFGAETKEAIITDESYATNYTNEGGVFGTYRFLHNIMGMWLQQECKRTWEKEGKTVDYKVLDKEALTLEPFTCIINPNYSEFEGPGNMPKRIKDYAEKTGQKAPESMAATIRAILESLALECARSVNAIAKSLPKAPKVIHMVGGGTKSSILCQFMANATGMQVVAGPIEGTSLGNALMQFIALGEIKDLNEARQVVRASEDTKTYMPQDTAAWEKAYEKYLEIIEMEKKF